MTSDLTRRVASRVAKDFPTEKALQVYLKDHPKADPARHRVDKTEKKPKKETVVLPQGKGKAVLPDAPGTKAEPEPKADPDTKAEPEPKAEPEKKTWKDRFKGLSDKAGQFVESLDKNGRKFLEDPEFRKAALKDAVVTIAKSPKAYAKNLVKVAKHEKEHFQTAMSGVSTVLKGGKMAPEEKKALKTVATHMAITAAAAAMTGGSVLAITGAFGKGIGRQVAVKAVIDALENVHLLDEVGHIGHGLVDILQKIAVGGPKAKPEDKLAMLILATVTKQLNDMDDDMIKAALEDAAEGSDKKASMALRVAARYQVSEKLTEIDFPV